MVERFSESQIDEFKECFCLYDSDSDGLISGGEAILVMRSLGENVTTEEVDSMMKKIGKPMVKFPEFLKMMAKQRGKKINTEEEILAAFAACDKNSSGTINRAELQHYMTDTGDVLTRTEFDKMLKEAKFEKNQVIRYKDLVRVLTS